MAVFLPQHANCCVMDHMIQTGLFVKDFHSHCFFFNSLSHPTIGALFYPPSIHLLTLPLHTPHTHV